MKELFKLAAVIVTEGFEFTQKGLKSIDKQAKITAEALDITGQRATELGKNIIKFASGPVAAAIGGLTLLSNKVADYGDSMMDLTDITGLSTDTLQELEHVARAAGVDFNSLTGTVTKFQGKLPEIIKEGGRAYETIKQLGVNVYDSSGNIRDMNDLFPELIKKLQGIENVTQRNMMAQQLFGREMSALAPVLGMSADEFENLRKEAHSAGVVLSKEALESAADFKSETEQLTAQFTALWRGIAIDFIPIIRDQFFPIIKDSVIPAVKDFSEKLKDVFDWYSNLAPTTKGMITTFGLLAIGIGPVVLGFGQMLIQLKALLPFVTGLNLALASNPFALAALAITGIGLAVGHTVSAWQKWKEEIGQKVESKQVSQMVKDIGELIPLYAELEDMRYGAIIDDDRFKQVSDRIKELEKNLGDLGHEFTGSFGSKLQQAENLFDTLTGSVEKNTEAVTKNKTVLAGGGSGSSTLAVSGESPEDALKWEQEYNEAKAELGSYTNQKIIEDDRLKNEELALSREEKLNADIEAAKQELAIVEETENKKKSLRQAALDFTINSFNQLGSIMSMFTNNRLTALDQEYEKERENIENSTMSEEEKAKKLEALEKKKAEKETALKKKQAIREKAVGIFNIAISLAQGLVNAWSAVKTPFDMIFAGIQSGIITTLAGIQTAAIASAPLPMAEGSLVESGTGGVNALIGEGKEDEVVFPLETGVNMMIDKLANGFKKDNVVSQTQRTIQPRPLNINVGSWLGDESGIKRLTREIMPYLTLEAERVGATI